MEGHTEYDLAVVGGGVNGCGIARDAAGRGLRVLLLERGDLGGATSSASTKLIHGGLRYLEHREFRLVREALQEREVLLRSAPHIAWPLRFVLPAGAARGEGRPYALLRLGLLLYDRLGGRELLPATRALDLRRDPAGEPLKPGLRRALEYSDCWVDDSRMVALLARDAADRGADMRTRTACTSARRQDGAWALRLDAGGIGGKETARARVLVNAAGPWVSRFLAEGMGAHAPTRIRMVKGSHIVTRRLYAHDRCYMFQNPDRRIVFAIPYQEDFTLIGTTDQDFQGDPAAARISPEETAYLCEAANRWLRQPIGPADVVWSYSGVRPLRDDGASAAQEATRDYTLELDAPAGPDAAPPLLSVFGGKITTFRRLAEAAMARLAPFFPSAGPAWTRDARLPGGGFPWDGAPALAEALGRSHPFLDARTRRRLVRAYGTRAEEMLGDARKGADMGQDFGAGLTAREVEWLMRTEWARTAADVAWRRSKLGLRLLPDQIETLEAYMAGHTVSAAGATAAVQHA